MAYPQRPPQQAPQSNLFSQLAHVLVLILLLLVLLVILTKFQWIHCSQVPGNWCEIYCDQIMRSHSKVALVYGDAGLGDPRALENVIARARAFTFLEPFHQSVLSAGMLEGYDLVVLEHMTNITLTQAVAIEDYLNKGGSLLWIADAASDFYVDEFELAKARTMDEQRRWEAEKEDVELKDPHYYENALLNATKHRGFGFLERALMARFNETKAVSGAAKPQFKIVLRNHLLVKGLKPEFVLPIDGFAVVKENPAAVSKIAVLEYKGKEYPAVLETRYAGRVIYVAFPLEDADSITLIQNVLDYLVVC